MKLLILLLAALVFVRACDQSVIFLLDTSGSMAGSEERMVFGVNNLLKKMQKEYNPEKCRIDVEIHTFAETIDLLKHSSLFEDPLISVQEYLTGGGTALYDSLDAIIRNAPDNAVVVIATDGQDNMSREHSSESIRDQIKQAERQRGIDFIFVAQGPDAFSGGYSAGLQQNAYEAADLGASFVAIGDQGLPGAVGVVGIATLQKVSTKISSNQ